MDGKGPVPKWCCPRTLEKSKLAHGAWNLFCAGGLYWPVLALSNAGGTDRSHPPRSPVGRLKWSGLSPPRLGPSLLVGCWPLMAAGSPKGTTHIFKRDQSSFSGERMISGPVCVLRRGHPLRASGRRRCIRYCRVNFLEPDQLDLPCPAPFAKIFPFIPDPNQFTESHRPLPQRGVAQRHGRGAGCGGRGRHA